MDFVGSWKLRNILIKQMFGGGMKRKLMITRAIMHRSKILFMEFKVHDSGAYGAQIFNFKYIV